MSGAVDKLRHGSTPPGVPRMSGPELVPQLLAQREQLKVLYMSGYAENTGAGGGAIELELNYLPKPVTPSVLLRKVREVLGRA